MHQSRDIKGGLLTGLQSDLGAGLRTVPLARKLGIKEDHLVVILNGKGDALEKVLQAMPPSVRVSSQLSSPDSPDIVLYWPQPGEDMEATFQRLRQAIKPNGSIWAIIPKKAVATKRGVKLDWNEIVAAALKTGLVDNKDATITSEEYGTRFVIRLKYRT